MDYESFKEKMMEELKEKLEDNGINAGITVNVVNKLNESYEAMTVKPEGSNIGVNLPIEKLYERVDDMGFDALVDKTVEMTEKALREQPVVDAEAFSDYDQMKDKLVMEVVSVEKNKDLLETIPHENIEDMAVVYRFSLDSGEGSQASVLVTNQIMENMGVTHEQLRADAMENAPRLQPAEIKGMGEIMAEMMGMDAKEAADLGMIPDSPDDEKMFVASNPNKTHGASVMAYQDFMDQASERVGGDFFILPSSIHEIIIVPDDGNAKLADLESMVREVNATQVAPQDRLTDNVYHYDSKEKIFELGEKFEARQAAKEATAEKEEKGSLIDELKAKKEEVAKQPKKEEAARAGRSKGGEAI